MSRPSSLAGGLLCALLCAILGGCQATTKDESSTSAQPLLFTSEVDPSVSEVERFSAQLALLDAAACRETRLRQLPDLAHDLFVRSSSPALRAEAAKALGDGSYLASEAARARAPEEHDRTRAALVVWIDERAGEPKALVEAFRTLGDHLLAAEVAQRARARGQEQGSPGQGAGTAPLQVARRAWLELAAAASAGKPSPGAVSEALTRARALQHLGILEALENLCAASVGLLSPLERSHLARDRTRIALLRRDGPRALRAAVVALRGAAPGPDRLKAQLLLARAQLACGERDAALAEAQAASEAAGAEKSPADEARALGLLGSIFLRLGKAEAAASAYQSALEAARRAGQPELALRQRLNLVTAQLRAGHLSAARAALQGADHQPLGPDRAELMGQRQVTRALVALVGGELRPQAAALQVEEALQAARQAGCPELLERYATLPARLRGGSRSGS